MTMDENNKMNQVEEESSIDYAALWAAVKRR